MLRKNTILLCVGVNIRKWRVNPRIYTLAILITAFLLWHEAALTRYAATFRLGVAPWVFPHLMCMPAVRSLFGFLTMLLFSDAPFIDQHTSFLIIRAGRRSWVIAQMIYIVITALIYTLFIYALTILVLLPRISLTMDWGLVLRSAASGQSTIPGVMPILQDIISLYAPLTAALYSLLLFWIVAVFIGFVIFAFNLLAANQVGLAVAGFFVFLSFFTDHIGRVFIGPNIVYFSPVSWQALNTVDPQGGGLAPSLTYVTAVLLVSCLILALLAQGKFCRKDLVYHV